MSNTRLIEEAVANLFALIKEEAWRARNNEPKENSWRARNMELEASGTRFEKNIRTKENPFWYDLTPPSTFRDEECMYRVKQTEDKLWKVLYQKKRAEGVMYDMLVNSSGVDEWIPYMGSEFLQSKDKYRETPDDPQVKNLKATIRRSGGDGTTYEWKFKGTVRQYRDECASYGYLIASPITEVKKTTRTVYFGLFGERFYDPEHGIDMMITTRSSIKREDKAAFLKRLSEDGFVPIGEVESREVPSGDK